MNITASTPQSGALTKTESALLLKHERTIKQTQGAFIACGKALAEIRDQRLYRAKFFSFEDYCQTVWNWGRERARLLIEGASIADELPPEVQPLIQSEGQVRALSKVPKDARAAVVKEAAATGKVTAQSISNAAEKAINADTPNGNNCCHAHARAEGLTPASTPIARDSTGFAIPAGILPMWSRRGEVDEVLKAISKARVAVRHAMEKDDPLFQPVNMSGTCNELNHSFGQVQLAMPYAVCCTCQGISSEKCAACKGRGFISKHHYEMSVPVEVKAIRSKSCVL
jgi:hypothetical protein